MINKKLLVDELFRELNQIRTFPAAYISYLEERSKHYSGHIVKHQNNYMKTLEGVTPLHELIHDL